jgi:hypothetical protein
VVKSTLKLENVLAIAALHNSLMVMNVGLVMPTALRVLEEMEHALLALHLLQCFIMVFVDVSPALFTTILLTHVSKHLMHVTMAFTLLDAVLGV